MLSAREAMVIQGVIKPRFHGRLHRSMDPSTSLILWEYIVVAINWASLG